MVRHGRYVVFRLAEVAVQCSTSSDSASVRRKLARL
jgi:hypothetical protein